MYNLHIMDKYHQVVEQIIHILKKYIPWKSVFLDVENRWLAVEFVKITKWFFLIFVNVFCDIFKTNKEFHTSRRAEVQISRFHGVFMSPELPSVYLRFPHRPS